MGMRSHRGRDIAFPGPNGCRPEQHRLGRASVSRLQRLNHRFPGWELVGHSSDIDAGSPNPAGGLAREQRPRAHECYRSIVGKHDRNPHHPNPRSQLSARGGTTALIIEPSAPLLSAPTLLDFCFGDLPARCPTGHLAIAANPLRELHTPFTYRG